MKYPLGIQDFEGLRTDGYLYLDKTALIHQLIQKGKYYFLSRPRRFGKSLLISTLEAYFQGKQELFRGLALEQLEQEWEEYPVLHLDLNARDYSQPDSLHAELNKHLEIWEAAYGGGYSDRAPEERFQHVISNAFKKTGKKVVILVDEYDKPLIQVSDDKDRQDQYRKTLKAFYGVEKTMDRYIQFGFFTGVTKFSKVSVFSDLNNLTDITMDRRYAELCGITEAEIHRNLDAEVAELAEANHISKETCYEKLKQNYDGYHFEASTTGMYNPFSLLHVLDAKTFKDYWFETGTPTILVEALKQSNYRLDDLTKEEVTADLLGSIDSIAENPLPILYQSGYLTIKDYNQEFETYRLGFPNLEVERGFSRFLLPHYTPLKPQQGETIRK